jgi:hypothetical protein
MIRDGAILSAATRTELASRRSRDVPPEGFPFRLGAKTFPTLGISDAFVADILKPYRPVAQYLKSAHIAHVRDTAEACSGESTLMRGWGTFAIPESCYTHCDGFNTPEFNICYNQLAYVLFGKCIEGRVLDVLDFISFANYKRHQLKSWLIASITSHYFRTLDTQQFVGELTLDRAAPRGHAWFFFTRIAFCDADGVKAEGSVTLAFSPPR